MAGDQYRRYTSSQRVEPTGELQCATVAQHRFVQSICFCRFSWCDGPKRLVYEHGSARAMVHLRLCALSAAARCTAYRTASCHPIALILSALDDERNRMQSQAVAGGMARAARRRGASAVQFDLLFLRRSRPAGAAICCWFGCQCSHRRVTTTANACAVPTVHSRPLLHCNKSAESAAHWWPRWPKPKPS